MSTYNEHVGESESCIDTPAIPVGDEAIARAILALVEQQRIANLIALTTYLGDDDENIDLLRAEAAGALVEWVQHSPDDEHPEVRPDIADALGIKTGDSDE